MFPVIEYENFYHQWHYTLYTVERLGCHNVEEQELYDYRDDGDEQINHTVAPYHRQTQERIVTWTSVSHVLIGSSDIRTVATYSYTIPNSIPNEAKEVLVLAVGRQGYSSRDIDTYLKIYTLEELSHYEQYIYMHSYNQDAYNTVSDNLWFPMTSNRRIYLQVPNTNGGGNWVGLYAIGYR